MAEASFPRHCIVEYHLHSPREPQKIGHIACMDRRRPVTDDPVLGHLRLFPQWRGGRYGIGHSLAVAMETFRPGSFVDQGISVARFAQGVGFLLATHKLEATKHGPNCAGIELAKPTHNAIANGANDAAMFTKTQQIMPWLSEDRYIGHVGAAQRIRAAGLLSSPAEINQELTAQTIHGHGEAFGIPDNGRPTLHAELDTTEHRQIAIVADFRPDVALDRQTAHREGWGAYYSSLGAAPHLIACLPPEMYVPVDTLQSAETMSLGALATHYLLDESGEGPQPYPIEAIY